MVTLKLKIKLRIVFFCVVTLLLFSGGNPSTTIHSQELASGVREQKDPQTFASGNLRPAQLQLL